MADLDPALNPFGRHETSAAATAAPAGANPFGQHEPVAAPAAAAEAPKEVANNGYGEKPWWWWGPGSGPREMVGVPPEDPNAEHIGLGDAAKNFALNLPSSLKKHATELYDTVTGAVSGAVNHPGETAATIRDELPDLPGHLMNFGASMIPGLINKYGSMEAAKKSASEDPAGFLMDASMLLPAAGALGKVGRGVDKVASVADPAQAMATLRKAATVGGKVAASAADTLVQSMEGIGSGALEKMFESGKAVTPGVWKSMTGGIDVNKSYDLLNDSVDKLVKKRSDSYLSDMAAIKGADKPVDFTKVDRAVGDAGKIGYYKAPGDKSPGPGIRIENDPGVMDARGKILAKIEEFRQAGPAYHTALGFDSLKKSIADIGDSLRGPMNSATPGSVFAGKISGAVRKTIMDEVPAYGDAMKSWGDKTDQLNQLKKEFSLGDEAKKFTAIRKMQKVWRQTADVAHGERTNMLDEALKGSGNENLMSHLAADQFHPLTPRGLRGSFLPYAIMSSGSALPLMSSPRLSGTAAYGLGRLSGSPFAKVPRASYDIAERGAPAAARIQNQLPQEPAEKRGGFFRGAR